MGTYWGKVTCGMAVYLLWISKHRSGVVSNMMVDEWRDRQNQDGKAILTVKKHKTGDKEPALIVITDEIEQFMNK